MSLTLGLLIAASATAASKDFLASDPMLAGSKIDYCETPKNCKVIDRRKEAVTLDQAVIVGDLALKINEFANEFYTLTVTFARSEEVPGSFKMQLRYSQPAKNFDRK